MDESSVTYVGWQRGNTSPSPLQRDTRVFTTYVDGRVGSIVVHAAVQWLKDYCWVVKMGGFSNHSGRQGQGKMVTFCSLCCDWEYERAISMLVLDTWRRCYEGNSRARLTTTTINRNNSSTENRLTTGLSAHHTGDSGQRRWRTSGGFADCGRCGGRWRIQDGNGYMLLLLVLLLVAM